MDEEKRQAKVQYNTERKKQLIEDKIIKTYSTVLNSKEFDEIDKIIKINNMSKADFLRYALKQAKIDDTLKH